jgi:hypothetical protein
MIRRSCRTTTRVNIKKGYPFPEKYVSREVYLSFIAI